MHLTDVVYACYITGNQMMYVILLSQAPPTQRQQAAATCPAPYAAVQAGRQSDDAALPSDVGPSRVDRWQDQLDDLGTSEVPGISTAHAGTNVVWP